MFENILGQEALVSQLRKDLEARNLPSSLLFYGDRYTAKQTTALELARVLLCEEGTARWKCDCPSCRMNRRLVHPGLVITGPHNFMNEINACGHIYVRQERKGSAFLFIRALEKCIRRFDPHVYEAKETKEKKYRDIITALDEAISLFDPDEIRPDEKTLEKAVKQCMEKAKVLAEEYPEDNIPVSAIRNLTAWVHTTGMSNRKVVIIENCERMVDSSRNALLKILEEPPKGVYFICITTRKGLVIPTILSRLRPYHFPKRREETERKVLKTIFSEETGEYPDLESYFLAWQGIKTDDLRAYAVRFIELLHENPTEYYSVIQDMSGQIKEKQDAYYFLRFLTDRLREVYGTSSAVVSSSGSKMDATRPLIFEQWNGLIQDCLRGISLYNQKPALKIEDLFLSMRQVR